MLYPCVNYIGNIKRSGIHIAAAAGRCFVPKMRGLKRGRGSGVVWRFALPRNPPCGENFVLRGIEPRAYRFRMFAQGAVVYEGFFVRSEQGEKDTA